jgi:hypothetical protein
METKYIRLKDGTIAIFNESTGVEHWAMAYDHFGRAEATDAGFMYWQDGSFHVYGRSSSLGLSCDVFAANDLSNALKAGKLYLVPLRDEHFYATTRSDKGTSVAHVSELYSAGVLWDESMLASDA